jgi:hypothetical protein
MDVDGAFFWGVAFLVPRAMRGAIHAINAEVK